VHPLTAAIRLADRSLALRPPHTMRWDWGDAILLYGLARLASAVDCPTARRRLVDAVTAYHVAHARDLPRIDRADRCAPALSALVLARSHGCRCGLRAAARAAEFVATAPRTRLGAIEHLGTSPLRRLVPPSLWVDSLAMMAVFAAQWATHVGDAELLDFAAAQPGAYASMLQDPREGLFRHAYLLRLDRVVPRAPAFWLRGNGWALFAMVEVLEALPEKSPATGEIVGMLTIAAGALARHQRPAGGWGTVVNDPRTYEETSGTALCAYALAKGARLGWLDPTMAHVARRALGRVTARLQSAAHGYSMPAISAPTNPMPGWAYGLVPRVRDAPWGVGAYLLAATEAGDPTPLAPRPVNGAWGT